MITNGMRKPGLFNPARTQWLGLVQQSRIPGVNCPSTSRNVISGPPISYSALRKGKQRASLESVGDLALAGSSLNSRDSRVLLQIRHFHVSRPRNALPLIPATAAILKSTSILTIITYISRILISFFPIGTLAAFRFSRIARWLDNGNPPPETTEEAKEFFLMWCRGEKERRVNQDEALLVLSAEPVDCGGLRLPDGRIAYQARLPKQFRPRAQPSDKRHLQFLKATTFFLPPLPSASVRFFNEFSVEEQGQIQRLRTHWIVVRMSKDRLRFGRILMVVLFGLPVIMLFGVWVAALERTPLTGRWRLILLTPEEEDHISRTLSGQNWYKSVSNLLTTPEAPAPPIVPLDDWRWQWVATTLRQLEAVVVNEASRLDSSGEESTIYPLPAQQAKLGIPTPPSTGHPIKPRPRMSCMIHSALPGGDKSTGQEHLELGPPYSLLIMEKHDRNAFSYGFGGKGAGGIVVFTGLLDEILKEGVPDENRHTSPGFWSSLLGSTPAKPRPRPTEQQTLHLACVLAHEMGHLLLSHHLEALSQQQVLWPSVLGLAVDLTRAFIWPLTFFLGPTVNDALANVGRTGISEISDKYGEIGFQWKHEYEADFAGIRLLALAGFDPRAAVAHFSESVADLHEIQPLDKEKDDTLTSRLFKLWTETTHPSAEQRVAAIKQELDRWDWTGVPRGSQP